MPEKRVELSYHNPVLERMSREELLGLMWRRIKLLLAYAYHIPFYRRRFRQVHLTPDDIQSWEDFRRLPPITKADLVVDQREYPPYGSVLGTRQDRVIRFHLTSGTSGKGQQVLGLTRADLEVETMWGRGFYWAGVRRGDLMANLSPTSVSPMAGPDSKTKAFDRLGVSHLNLGLAFSTEQKLEVMKRFSPHFVWGPSKRTQQVAQEMGIDPRRDFPRLKGILFTAASSPEEVLAQEDFWGAPMGGAFGSTETKTGSAHTCESGMVINGKLGQYHIFEDYCLWEFLDRDTREPVPLGEPGEVVLTNITLEASPLIRFATNDKAIPIYPPDCGCGRPFLGVQIDSFARYDDMMKIRGMNVWPVAIEAVILGHAEVAEYQGRVWTAEDGHEEVTITVEFASALPREHAPGLLACLAEEIREKIGLRMALVEATVALPRFEVSGVKPRRWKDERTQPGR